MAISGSRPIPQIYEERVSAAQTVNLFGGGRAAIAAIIRGGMVAVLGRAALVGRPAAGCGTRVSPIFSRTWCGAVFSHGGFLLMRGGRAAVSRAAIMSAF